jgi:hypothetical protein
LPAVGEIAIYETFRYRKCAVFGNANGFFILTFNSVNSQISDLFSIDLQIKKGSDW